MRIRYLDIDDRTEDLRDLMKGRRADAQDFLEKFDLSWIYHEAALEGAVLTGAELTGALGTHPVVEAGMATVFKELRNFRDAIELVKDEVKRPTRLSMTLVKRFYDTLHRDIPSRLPLELRQDMPLHRTYFHDIVQPPKIMPGLTALFEHINSPDFKEEHPIRQAASVHHTFMELFPMADHSGKVARLLMNLILVREGYLPVVIHSIDRQRYYEALRLPHQKFREFIMGEMVNGLDNAWRFFYPPEERREASNE